MDRKQAILRAIINKFIETAEPVGSQTILVSYQFSVSPATIRNEMATLENEGFIYQPHTSAGRVPTDTGYRLYVDELADYDSARKLAEKKLEKVMANYQLQKAREKMYDAVNILAQATDNVSFATLPDNKRTFFLGVSNVLRQPEFSRDPLRASQVVEVLEETDNFVTTLKKLDIGEEVKTFIGKENLLPQIQSCAIMVAKYRLGDFMGYLGLLGPTRMNYAYNRAMIEKIKELLGT